MHVGLYSPNPRLNSFASDLCVVSGAFRPTSAPRPRDSRHDAKMALVYAQPGANLAGYTEVILLDPQVAFKKNWERDQRTASISSNRLSSKDVEAHFCCLGRWRA